MGNTSMDEETKLGPNTHLTAIYLTDMISAFPYSGIRKWGDLC